MSNTPNSPIKAGEPLPLSPHELTTLAKALSAQVRYIQDLAPGRYGQKEVAFLAALYFLSAEASEQEQALYCACLVSLLEQRVYLGKDGSHPVPEYDPELGLSLFQAMMLDICFAAISYHFYWTKRIETPELALGPLSFQTGFLADAIAEGLDGDNEFLPHMKESGGEVSTAIARFDALAGLYPLFVKKND